MSAHGSSSAESEDHPIYYLGRVGQRAQMTRASTTGHPLVLPPPARMLDPRPQLPPISRIAELQQAPSSPARYATTQTPPFTGAPPPPVIPMIHPNVSPPPTWSSSNPPRALSRPASSYGNHPALYPQRASFQSRNPGTVYEALSPVEYGFRAANSMFNEASYSNNPLPSGPVSTFESPLNAQTSQFTSPTKSESLEHVARLPSYKGLADQSAIAPEYDVLSPPPAIMQDRYLLTIRQQPMAARACGFGERDRRVIDPPPVVQLSLRDFDPTSKQDLAELKFPFNIIHCALISVPANQPQAPSRPTSAPYTPAAQASDADVTAVPDPQQHDRISRKLMGNIFASPFVATDPDAPESNLQQARKSTFFIFPDLSCRQNGRYRLRFTLMKVPMGAETPDGGQGSVYGSIDSDVFQVYSAKDFPGMTASSRLIRELKKQGAAVNVRKGKDRNLAKEIGKRSGGSVSGSAEDEPGGEASARKKRG